MEKILNKILNDAIEKKTSDIHFIPNEEIVIIKFRIKGDINFYDKLELSQFEKLLSYLKFVTHLDVSEKNKAQSGIMTYEYNALQYNIRASSLPQSVGIEACVLRIIPAIFQSEQTIDLNLLRLMHKGSGLILISGPTGSGKSTLMYQLLNYAVGKNKQIISIEDPVEQKIEGIVQINVNNKANITYQNSLKAILRCDPDIIMIGEIRDSETAQNVINASLSGHLVLSTIHSNTSVGAIHRLIEMGITKIELEQCVEIILNQRLVNIRDDRRLVYESLNKNEIKLYFNNQLTKYKTISEQLEEMFHNNKISLMEYEKYVIQ